MRKAFGFDITDRIAVRLSSTTATDEAVIEYMDWIKEQVLANSIELVAGLSEGEDVSFDEYSLKAQVERRN